ncbi:MAG: hypothetical protein ACI81T_002704 [Bacteroidia bacterium]|jgi:hypothetical protein
MIKPTRILTLLIYIACMVGLVMLMSPEEIKINENWTIKIFTFQDLLPQKKESVDMSAVESLQNSIDSLESLAETDSSDRIVEVVEEVVPDKLNRFLQFPKGKETILDDFFHSLQNEIDTSLIRIVHYGDSQIEGDRITEYLRNRLQKRFGGCGVGMIPPTEIKGIRSTSNFEATENFVRYEIFGAVKKFSLHRDYGYLGSYHKFAYQDHENKDSVKEVRGNLVYRKPLLRTYDRIYEVEKVKMAYRNRFAPIKLNAVWNGKPQEQILEKSTNLAIWQIPVEGKLSKLQLEMFSKGDPDIYGVAFDCNTGIALDNAPFRGSSGIEFTSVNREIMRQQVEKLNIKLMILQFGTNVIPYVREEYSHHKKLFIKQLKFLKSLSPDLNIIVIGPSDMARKKGANFVSYPNIPVLRDALREAAFETDCAFWDLYNAMGGQNSITGWVDSEPALAKPDYTHFTRKGAKLVGEMFYNSILKSFGKFKKRQ